jgi:hypothetical protein
VKEVGNLRLLYEDELRDLVRSLSTLRVVISRRLRWAGNVISMGRRYIAYRNLLQNGDLEYQDGDGRITLGWFRERL